MSSLSLSPSNRLQSSGRSRPSHKGTPGHPDPEIGGGDRPQKKFFRLFGPHFGLKIRGAPPPRVPPLDPAIKPPLTATSPQQPLFWRTVRTLTLV